MRKLRYNWSRSKHSQESAKFVEQKSQGDRKMKSIHQIARAAYHAHSAAMGFKKALDYSALSGKEQAAWIAAAQACRDEMEGVL